MIRTRAERKTGQLLKETEALGLRHKGGQPKKERSQKSTVLLADYGIKKDQSSDWQKLADIPTFMGLVNRFLNRNICADFG
jgi:hypothetical protein